jgi:glyoxylase-like metal-dependent hydrolase (beta-lactamase superfamily II)
VAKNIYRFPVPLPGSPLKELNSHVITDNSGPNLLIDVGFNTGEGYTAIRNAFSDLALSFNDTDIFLTHLHADHSGLTEVLKKECGRIFISEADSLYVNWASRDEYWIEFMKVQDSMGFPESAKLNYKDHPAYRGGTLSHTDFEFITEGMGFSYGGYNFEAIDLKGHTPGQMGLYDKENSILFCGDHILNKITPNINLWDFDADYLGLFLENLKKVRGLNVRTLFSAHRTHIDDVTVRIDELLAHHDRRLSIISSVVSSGKSTAYDVAMEVPWDYAGGYFGDFPGAQKWFAASEVFAHLEHLHVMDKIDKTMDGPIHRYYAKTK